MYPATPNFLRACLKMWRQPSWLPVKRLPAAGLANSHHGSRGWKPLYWQARKPAATVLLAIATAFPASTGLRAASNFDAQHSLSWGSNIGWLNWRGDEANGVEVDQFVGSGFLYAANVGWINLGSGVPADGMNYQNNSATDFGVNVGPQGHLSGFAYGANIGWINFAPIGQPRIDLGTSRLSGYVYGANVGWINLGDSTYDLQIESLAAGQDADRDGIPDAWEVAYANDLSTLTVSGDFDHDGNSDLGEYFADTDPTDATDHLRILKFSISPDRASSVLTWRTRASRQYVVELRTDIGSSGQWVDSGLGLLSADGPSLSREIPQQAGGSQHYFRIRAVRPLSR